MIPVTAEQAGPTDGEWTDGDKAVVTAFHEVVERWVTDAVADASISRLEHTGEHARAAITEVAARLSMAEDDVLRVIVADALAEEAIQERDEAGHRYIIPVDDDKFISRENATPDQIRAYRDSLVEGRDQARKNRAHFWSLIPDAPLDGPEGEGAVKVEHASRQQLEDACFDCDLEIAALDREIEFWTGLGK